MNPSIDRHIPRLSKKATRLRTQNCQRFDIRSSNPLSEEDKTAIESIRKDTGWEELCFRTDGKDHVAEFRMAGSNSKAGSSATTYI